MSGDAPRLRPLSIAQARRVIGERLQDGHQYPALLQETYDYAKLAADGTDPGKVREIMKLVPRLTRDVVVQLVDLAPRSFADALRLVPALRDVRWRYEIPDLEDVIAAICADLHDLPSG